MSDDVAWWQKIDHACGALFFLALMATLTILPLWRALSTAVALLDGAPASAARIVGGFGPLAFLLLSVGACALGALTYEPEPAPRGSHLRAGLRCAYCHAEASDTRACGACGTLLHADCVALAGGCVTLGCPARRARGGACPRHAGRRRRR